MDLLRAILDELNQPIVVVTARVADCNKAQPGRSGLELLQNLRLLYPKLPVLILSQYPE